MLRFKSYVKKSAIGLALSSNPLAFESAKRLVMNLMKVKYEPVMSELKEPVCCISIDFDVTNPSRALANSEGTKVLLSLSEKYEVPLTWAVCGKTVQDYDSVFEQILSSTSEKEIAVHTYSHIDVSRCTKSELLEDLDKFKAVVGISDFSTFIFPWNKVGHFDTLRELGFIAYRGKDRRIGMPTKNEGLWNISPVAYAGSNMYYQDFLPIRLLDLCVKTGSVFHLWTHPWDIALPSAKEYTNRVLEPLFYRLSSYKKSGLIKTMTMENLAKYMNQKENLPSMVAEGVSP
jgi:peptidoglycan/xylan/chitin deacetylase (PgdA/CDA1 family)